MIYVIGERPPLGKILIATMKADVAVVSSITPAKVSALSIPVEAGGRYLVEAWMPFSLDGTASGYKLSFIGPTAADVSMRRMVIDGVNKTISSYAQGTTIAGTSAALAVIGNHEMQMRATITFTDAGEFYALLAQHVSDASAITLKSGAQMILTKIN